MFSACKRVTLGVAFLFLTVGATTAIAGNGVGGVFNLGEVNTVNAETTLRGTTNTPQLSVDALSTGASADGLVATNKGPNNAIWGSNTGTSAGGVGVRGTSTAGTGVFGRHARTTGTQPGVEGQTASTSANAVGVQGSVTDDAPGSLSAGVRGDIESTTSFSGAGVYGRHAGNGYGVYAEGLGVSSSGLYSSGGFYGSLNYASQPGSTAVYASGNGRGIDGYSEATDGSTTSAYGVFGDADAINGGVGVYGRADGGTGANYGVRGEVYSADGYGGHFQNFATGNNGTGVAGQASGSTGSSISTAFYAGGVEGVGGNGVIGMADRASGYGLLGIQGSGVYAGYFSGPVHVTGNLSKGAGSFKIDHPLDPANKYLSHSFVESPDMKNIYDGQVELDARGAATVKLPDYFGALNRDFRYQLTAIGAAAPNLHISREVTDNRFAIAGGKPGMEVSWQVTGIRKDAYANANRIQVEEDKPKSERGEYLYPELFGAPQRKTIGQQTSGNVRTVAPRAKADSEP